MTNHTNQWLIFGWSFDNFGNESHEVRAKLVESSTENDAIRETKTSFPTGVMRRDRFDEREIYPGIMPLHKLPKSEKRRLENHIDNDSTTKEINVRSTGRLLRCGSPWMLSNVFLELYYIQQHTTTRNKGSRSRTSYYTETLREIVYVLTDSFGLDSFRAGTVYYEFNANKSTEGYVEISLEMPVKHGPLARVALIFTENGEINLRAEYRFGIDDQWYEFFDGSIRDFPAFARSHWKAIVLELSSFIQKGLSNQELIDYLGVRASMGSARKWEASVNRSIPVIQENVEQATSKLGVMIEAGDSRYTVGRKK